MEKRNSRRPADGGASAAHREAFDSIAERPCVLSWKASAGYAPEMRVPPDMQIRLLAQQANFHGVADEALYAQCLRSHGIEDTAAREAYRLLRLALGRYLPAVRGVRFADGFYRRDARACCVEFSRLSDHALFAAAVELAPAAFAPRAREVIGHSSPEVQMALAQMALGARAGQVVLRPFMLSMSAVCAVRANKSNNPH